MKRIFLMLALICSGTELQAQTQLTLDSCRAMAIRNNKELAITRAESTQAKWEHKASKTNYYPKISLTAGYLHTGNEISLLNKEQKNTLTHLGTNASNNFAAIAGQIVTKHPDLAPLLQSVAEYLPMMSQAGNNLGKGLADALRTDNRNMTAGAVLLTQPLYMGGKIRAYHRITQYQEALAADRMRANTQQLLLDVDKAYWQVVSLANKQRLAANYRNMLARLDSDVVKMVAEGVATKSNELNVSVKLNEAEMTLTKVDDGLTLSRMLLCQLCGLPLDSNPRLADEESNDLTTAISDVKADIKTAFDNRPELCMLQTASNIYFEKINIERSNFLPQLALTGGYMLSNPNVFNSFERKFRGTWSVGIMLKMPIWNWGEGKYKIQAAKAEALIASLKSDEAREKIELQVTQEAFKVNEANRKLKLSLKHLEKAEENLRTARIGFDEGVITTSDLLAAQTAWLQAHSDKIDAQIDTKISQASYNKALGL